MEREERKRETEATERERERWADRQTDIDRERSTPFLLT